MNEGRDRDAGRLFGGTLALLRANAGLVAGALVTLTVLGVVSDLLGRNGQAVNLVSLPATLLFQYEVTFASLAHLGLSDRRGRRRFWALLGLNILYGLGVF